MITDYIPGDPPVPIDAVVEYDDGARFKILGHDDPEKHPYRRTLPDDLSKYYLDGVAYYLWPIDVAVKFGNRDRSMGWVRRTSFRVVELPDNAHEAIVEILASEGEPTPEEWDAHMDEIRRRAQEPPREKDE